jgi:hypothetical protein
MRTDSHHSGSSQPVQCKVRQRMPSRFRYLETRRVAAPACPPPPFPPDPALTIEHLRKNHIHTYTFGSTLWWLIIPSIFYLCEFGSLNVDLGPLSCLLQRFTLYCRLQLHEYLFAEARHLVEICVILKKAATSPYRYAEHHFELSATVMGSSNLESRFRRDSFFEEGWPTKS